MNEQVYNWLKYWWFKSNISKYHKYFKEWVDNLTPTQIEGFEHNMKADYINHNN